MNVTIFVVGTHYVVLDTVANSQKLHRRAAQHIFAQPLVTLAVPGPQPLPDSYNNSYVTQVWLNRTEYIYSVF